MKKNIWVLGILAIAAMGFTWKSDPVIGKAAINKAVKVGLAIGDEAPDLDMKGPDGKTYKLSSLRGKIVLIDFWASWCGPCRRENPHVVEAYNKYQKAKFKNAKGFEVYSVSLDKNQDSWVKAIDQDRLSWKYHVCDFKGWESAAAGTFGVRSIPTNFLIDQNGIILEKGLRGTQSLSMAIDKHVSSF